MMTAPQLDSTDNTTQKKTALYKSIVERISLLLETETDEIAALATVACELHLGILTDWTGFYRVTAPELLTVGPYQGTHGCLRIPFHRGVCGESARTKTSINVHNINDKKDHIACSSSTLSELVIPVFNPAGEVVAVLDLDSNTEAFFDDIDQHYCEVICAMLSRFY